MIHLKKRQISLTKFWLAHHFPMLKSKWKQKYETVAPLEPAEMVRVQFRKVDMPRVGLVKERKDQGKSSFWPKYRRFLEHSEIPYQTIDMDRSDWMQQIKDLDILIWRPLASPARLKSAKDKVYAAEEYLGITTIPSYRDLWLYEEKINQYYALKALGLPVVDTFVSHDREEALAYLELAEYPLVWKVNRGSGSLGVFLLKDKNQGVRLVNKVFGKGRTTYWRYLKQKDYVYLQNYYRDCGQDIRVITVGDRYFGLMREPDKGDFRASGAGHLIWQALPEDALRLARRVQKALRTDSIVVDMLRNPDTGELGIIEASQFIGAYRATALVIDGVPGCYKFQDGDFSFLEGRFWTQELTLLESFKSWAKGRGITIQVEPE